MTFFRRYVSLLNCQVNQMYFYAFFSQWCINITAQLLSVSNYIAVDKIIIGPFGPIVSYQSLGHVGGCLTNIHHFDYSPLFLLSEHAVTAALFSVAALLCLFSLYVLLTKACFQSATHCVFLLHWLLYYCHCYSFLFATLQNYKLSACTNNTRH